MLLVVAMLTTMVNGVVTTPKSHWKSVPLEAYQPNTSIDVSFEIPQHVSRIQVSVVTLADAQRFQQGRSYRPICMSAYERSARMRCTLADAGPYAVLIDNRLDTRFDAAVKLKVEQISPSVVAARTLPPQRRLIVITVSILFFLGVVMYSARQLMR